MPWTTRFPFTTVAIAGAVAALAVAVVLPAAEGRRPAAFCDRAAGIRGSDAARGTIARPFRSVRRLLSALRPGEVGCLLGGTFVEDVRVVRGGRAGRPITVRSAPGTRSVIAGYVWITPRANYVTISNLTIDGSRAVPNTFQVQGDFVTLRRLEITNRNKPGRRFNGICVLAGAGGEDFPAHVARHLVVEHSRIHDCGDDAHEHAIYLEFTRRAVIRDNYLYDNPGHGVDMYPDARWSLVERNVIDGNGAMGKSNLIFAGERPGGEYRLPHGSRYNLVRYNLITNSRGRFNVDSYYPAGSLPPVGNRVVRNCVWRAPRGNFGSTGGYAATANVEADPLYLHADRRDFRLRPGSPCAGFGPRR